MKTHDTKTKVFCDCCGKKIKEPYDIQLDRYGIIDMKHGSGLKVALAIENNQWYSYSRGKSSRRRSEYIEAELCRGCFRKIIRTYFALLLDEEQ